MKVEINIFDDTFSDDHYKRTRLARIELPTTNDSTATDLITFAEANFSMGVTDLPSDYFAGLRAMFYAFLSANYVRGVVVVEAKVCK